jgi:hypothetical protein
MNGLLVDEEVRLAGKYCKGWIGVRGSKITWPKAIMQCSGSLSAPDSSPSSYQNAQVRPEGDDFLQSTLSISYRWYPMTFCN